MLKPCFYWLAALFQVVLLGIAFLSCIDLYLILCTPPNSLNSSLVSFERRTPCQSFTHVSTGLLLFLVHCALANSLEQSRVSFEHFAPSSSCFIDCSRLACSFSWHFVKFSKTI